MHSITLTYTDAEWREITQEAARRGKKPSAFVHEAPLLQQNRKDIMGTRADFYVGRGEKAEWLGSIAWDGYPDGLDESLLLSTTDGEFREQVSLLQTRDDWTATSYGWPWPWDDSQTTDCAYAFDDGKVWISFFGSEWQECQEHGFEYPETAANMAMFPNMSSLKNVTLGKRSGVILVTASEEQKDVASLLGLGHDHDSGGDTSR